MTLVLSCLTRDFVIQVSDRRITQVGTGDLMDDMRNKATIWCDTLAFAYSGNAEMAGERTDIWLASTIAPCDNMDQVAYRVRDAATQHFAQLAPMPHHAFVCVGWVMSSQVPLTPLYLTISNALDEDGRWTTPQSAFGFRKLLLPPNLPVYLCPPIGAAVEEAWRIELEGNLARAVERGVSAVEIVRLLARTVRRVASWNSKVGESLLATVVPRPVGDGGFTVALTAQAAKSSIEGGRPTCFDIPARSDEPVVTFPNRVCRGNTITDVRLGSVTPPELS